MIKRMTVSIALTAALAAPVAAESLTEEQVALFLDKTPAIEAVLASTNQDLSKAENKQVQNAIFDLRPYTTLTEIMATKPSMAMLDQVARKSGYDGFADYAQVFDRIFSIAITGDMVATAATLGEPNPDPALSQNPYAYVNDDSNPPELRAKIRNDLNEFCQERCVNPDDMEIVGRHYEAVAEAVHVR
ncbi:hypothetical protein [Marinobacter sp. CA1]|nr:hypothetical protein [Marinobacter sp. CA1]UDL05696.1 hypothetical protein J2887_02690 [Marinobacter sp. CA1]